MLPDFICLWFRVSFIVCLWKCTCDGLFVGIKLKLSSWLFIYFGMHDEYVKIDGMQVEFLVKLLSETCVVALW